MVSDNRKYGGYKAFGVGGQVTTKPTMYATAKLDAGTGASCETRYTAVNLVAQYSSTSADDAKTNALILEVTKLATAGYSLELTAEEKKITTPIAIKASPFLQTDAAMHLMATTAATAALVAATLY